MKKLSVWSLLFVKIFQIYPYEKKILEICKKYWIQYLLPNLFFHTGINQFFNDSMFITCLSDIQNIEINLKNCIMDNQAKEN